MNKNNSGIVIFVAGLIGVGKSTLARVLAERLGMHYYDADTTKQRIYKQLPDYELHIQNGMPFPPEIRLQACNAMANDLGILATQWKSGVVFDETLLTQAVRNICFSAAEKYFGQYLVIHIQAHEWDVKKRLAHARDGHMLKGNAFGMYLALQKQFEPFVHVDINFLNDDSDRENAKNRLTILVEAALKERGF